MDPISQGVLGAVAATTIAKPDKLRLAALVGCAGGMLADLDVLIKSPQDPLLTIEYHRHFSHSLAFIPIGGLITALLFYPFLRKRLPALALYLYSTIGYTTAGLLDACTSYGTQLFWPFSDLRVSWSIISIVDPLFTVPLLALVGCAVFKKSALPGKSAALFAIAYLTLGVLQHQRASTYQTKLISERGHQSASRLTVKPSLANLLLWRSLYLYEGNYYVDALRLGILSDNKTYPGASLPAYELSAPLSELAKDSPLASDLTRFDHFSEGYLAALPDEPSFITDLRYSAIPNAIDPLWGLNLAKINEHGHAAFETRRDISKADRKDFKQMLLGH